MILRVKRRRDVESLPPTILLENSAKDEENCNRSKRQRQEMDRLGQLLQSSAALLPSATAQSIASSAANAAMEREERSRKKQMLFRRINATPASTESQASRGSTKRNRRDETVVQVVDAKLSSSPDKERQSITTTSFKKAKTVSLQVMTSQTFNQEQFWKDPTSPTASSSPAKTKAFDTNKKKKKSTLLLSPLDRMVNDKLTSLLSSHDNIHHHAQIMQYIQFLQYDLPRYNNSSQHKTNYINFQCTKNGSTLLHICALHNDVQSTKLALQHGADVLARDEDGCTPLHLADLIGSDATLVQVLREEMEHRQLQLQDELKVANKVEDKEEDYVYDVYCLEENEDDNDENDCQNKQKGTTTIKEEKKDEVLSPKKVATGPTSDTTATESTSITTPDVTTAASAATKEKEQSSNNDTNMETTTKESSPSKQPTKIQLQNTIGYFDDDGKLVLEPSNIISVNKMGVDSDDENDDDYDSNNEAFDGNDYPEDEDSNDEDSDYNGVGSSRMYGTYNRDEIDDFNCGGRSSALSGAVVGGDSWKYSGYYDVNAYNHGLVSGSVGQYEEDDDGDYHGRMYGEDVGDNDDDCGLNRFAYDGADYGMEG